MGEEFTTVGLSISEIDVLPRKAPRSKLKPHRDLIRELRRRGRTYREVAHIFQERLGLSVAPSTLHSFIKVRARGRKLVQFELPSAEGMSTPSPASNRIAALKAKPVGQRSPDRRFVFRENEPLTLSNRGGGR